ncbi:MAG: pyruvate synthase subunit PorB [Candidatus Aenigmatarchaeota archaeon]
MDTFFCSGHTACAGCPMPIALRPILNAAGKNTIISNATSCSEIVSSQYPNSAWTVPYVHVAFECAAAVASGIEAACKKLDRNANIIVIAGDGGTADIGLQALSGMVERGHNVLYICYDNECYANTGVQRSSATPYGAWTTTSPAGKKSIGNTTFKKPVAEMMAVQGASYVATSSVAYPKDIYNKVKKALTINGPKFIHIHAPCPLAWKFDSSQTIKLAKLAVETGMWVIYEIENRKLTINIRSGGKNIEEYLKAQGRFNHLTDEEINVIQKKVNDEWKRFEEWESRNNNEHE